MTQVQLFTVFLHKLPTWIWIASIGIFLWSLHFGFRMWWKARELRKHLRAFASYLPSSVVSGAPGLAIREQIRQAVQGGGELHQAWWSQLERHLQFYQGRAPQAGVYLTVPSRDALPEPEVVDANYSSAFYHSQPGLITSAGLAVTFIAILAGLYHVSYDPSQISNPVQGIEGLINNLSGKFTTSVVALVCAMVFTFASRRIERGLERAYQSLLHSISRTFPLLSEAMILADIQVSGVEREKALKNITSDMVDGFRSVFLQDISPVLSQNLLDSLKPTLNALNDTMINLLSSVERMEGSRQESLLSDLKAALDAMHQSLVDSLGNIGKDFQDSLSGAAKEEFSNIKTTLAASVQLLEQMNGQFAESQALFGASLKDFYSKAAEEMDAWLMPLHMRTQELTTASTMLQAAGQGLMPVMERVDALGNQMQTILESAVEATRQLSLVEADMKAHAETAHASVQSLKTIQVRLGEALEQLGASQKEGVAMLHGYQATFQSTRDDLGQLDKNLGSAFHVIHEGLQAWTQSADNALRQFTTRSNEQLAGIARSLGAQLGDLGEKLGEFNDSLDKVVMDRKTL